MSTHNRVKDVEEEKLAYFRLSGFDKALIRTAIVEDVSKTRSPAFKGSVYLKV